MALVILHLPAEEAESHALIDQLNNTNFEFSLSTSPDDFMESAKFFEKRLREGEWAGTTPSTRIFWNNQQGDVKPPMEVIVKQEPPDEATKEPSKVVSGQSVSPMDASNLEIPIATEYSNRVEKSGGEKEQRRNEEMNQSMGFLEQNDIADQEEEDFGGVDDDFGGLDQTEDQPIFDINLKTEGEKEKGRNEQLENIRGNKGIGQSIGLLEQNEIADQEEEDFGVGGPDFGGVDDAFCGLDETEDQPIWDLDLTRGGDSPLASERDVAMESGGEQPMNEGNDEEGPSDEILSGEKKQQEQEVAGFDADNEALDQSIDDRKDGEEKAMSGGNEKQRKRRVEIQEENDGDGDVSVVPKRRRSSRVAAPNKFYGERSGDDSGDDFHEADKTNKFSKRPVSGCDQYFKEDLARHMLGHAKPLVCRFCPYKCASPSNLRKHYRIHTGEKPFICDTCQTRFSRRHYLEAHRRTHHSQEEDDEDIPVTPKRRRSSRSVVPNKFYGEWVGDDSEDEAIEGISHVQMETNFHDQDTGGTTAHQGESAFSMEQAIEELDEHDGALNRPIGDGSSGNKKQKTLLDLLLEINNEDDDKEGSRIPVTPKCRRSSRLAAPNKFYREGARDDDQGADKVNKFPKCPVAGCDVVFKEDLAQHMKGHAKPLVCRFCPFKGPSPSHLLRHYRSHTGERPFACDTCHMRFFRRNHLKGHQFTHSGMKQFSCGDCGERFVHRRSVAKHARRFHSLEKG